MRRLAAFGSAFLAFIICLGCWVNSLNSVCNQGDLIYDKALVGTWEKSEGPQGRLAKIGANLFLEVTSREESPDELHFVQAHSFYKIGLEPGVLRTTFMKDEWLRDALAEKKVTIAHIGNGGSLSDIVLTADSGDVRKLLLQYGSDREAFPEENELVWKKE